MTQYIVCLGPVATSATTVANEGDTIELSDSDGEQLQRWGVVRPVEAVSAATEGDSSSDEGEDSSTEGDSSSDETNLGSVVDSLLSGASTETDQPPAPKEGKGKK